MSTISLRLPEALHRHLREFAQKEGISINQLAASALSEKLATSDYLEVRAARESREKFEAALAQVPNDPPDPQDTRISQDTRI